MVIINLLLLLAPHIITIVGYVLMRKWLPFTKFKYQQGACLLSMVWVCESRRADRGLLGLFFFWVGGGFGLVLFVFKLSSNSCTVFIIY